MLWNRLCNLVFCIGEFVIVGCLFGLYDDFIGRYIVDSGFGVYGGSGRR